MSRGEDANGYGRVSQLVSVATCWRSHASPVQERGVVELAGTQSQSRAAKGAGSGGPSFVIVSAVILVVVVLAVGVAAALLARTMAAAQSINKKAGVIADTAGGINTATDSVLQLNRIR